MYKCIKNVNTDQGSFKVGDVVGDILGEKYNQFIKIEEVVIETQEPAKVEEIKMELIVETPQEVEVTVETEEVQEKPKKKYKKRK